MDTDFFKDLPIDSLLHKEELRQKGGITLIASENYAYPQVLELLGSVFSNKYAEGYPGKRYYAGCEWVDQVELVAQARCRQLFKGDHANVQPHSGSSANMAVFMGLLSVGDTIMGMSLSSGGHLTHGHGVSFSGKLYNAVSYSVDPLTHLIDYEALERLVEKHRPHLIIAGASSYSRLIDFKKFSEIARSYNAYLLADCAHTAGLISVGLHPPVFPYADCMTGTTHKTLRGPRGGFIVTQKKYAQQIDRAVFPLIQGGPFMNVIAAKAVSFEYALQDDFVEYQQQALANAQAMVSVFKGCGYTIVSDGTDTHLFVIDLRNKGITGRYAEHMLEKVGIFVSRSTVPFDTEKPCVTSGIRIGTLAITARGCKESQAEEIGSLIDEVLKGTFTPEHYAVKVKGIVKLFKDF
ncbi:serine hydroxymethyltransferase [Candidatus Dependentiae bacterium]|nr:serine hydroxymethyltransferase [Candidatus Dependentiae bacterium]